MFCDCKYLQNASESISEHLLSKNFLGAGGMPPDHPIGGCAKETPFKATPYRLLPPQTPNLYEPLTCMKTLQLAVYLQHFSHMQS